MTNDNEWPRDKNWPRDKYDLQEDWSRTMRGYKPSIYERYKDEPTIGQVAGLFAVLVGLLAVLVIGATAVKLVWF